MYLLCAITNFQVNLNFNSKNKGITIKKFFNKSAK